MTLVESKCSNCSATLAPFGPLGYEGPLEASCSEQLSPTCPVEICSSCAAFFECEGGFGDDGQGVRRVARCQQCSELFNGR